MCTHVYTRPDVAGESCARVRFVGLVLHNQEGYYVRMYALGTLPASFGLSKINLVMSFVKGAVGNLIKSHVTYYSTLKCVCIKKLFKCFRLLIRLI